VVAREVNNGSWQRRRWRGGRRAILERAERVERREREQRDLFEILGERGGAKLFSVFSTFQSIFTENAQNNCFGFSLQKF